uniref:Putative myb family transcription factor n=1 Tax=Citrus sinensis TaxID=2711 RepID=Q5QQ25_CITSI|nr:putative myb family transcription factor [Citrus sinensis]
MVFMICHQSYLGHCRFHVLELNPQLMIEKFLLIVERIFYTAIKETRTVQGLDDTRGRSRSRLIELSLW